MNLTTKKIVTASMFAALCCVATMIIKIPTPMKGYLNIGDCVVLVSGFLLTPLYGFLAAAIGSMLADIFSGYVLYAPATFIIKGVMAISAHYIFRFLQGKIKNTPARIISGTVSETVMVLGYFVFEGFLYGFASSALNMPANIIQGILGLILGVSLTKLFEKHNITL